MTAVENAAVSQEELDAKAWAGFTEGNWQKDIDVRDFIQKNIADVSMTYLCRQLTKSVLLLLSTIVVTSKDTVLISTVLALSAKPNTKCIL